MKNRSCCICTATRQCQYKFSSYKDYVKQLWPDKYSGLSEDGWLCIKCYQRVNRLQSTKKNKSKVKKGAKSKRRKRVEVKEEEKLHKRRRGTKKTRVVEDEPEQTVQQQSQQEEEDVQLAIALSRPDASVDTCDQRVSLDTSTDLAPPPQQHHYASLLLDQQQQQPSTSYSFQTSVQQPIMITNHLDDQSEDVVKVFLEFHLADNQKIVHSHKMSSKSLHFKQIEREIEKHIAAHFGLDYSFDYIAQVEVDYHNFEVHEELLENFTYTLKEKQRLVIFLVGRSFNTISEAP